jgi:hypothetical protein
MQKEYYNKDFMYSNEGIMAKKEDSKGKVVSKGEK